MAGERVSVWCCHPCEVERCRWGALDSESFTVRPKVGLSNN